MIDERVRERLNKRESKFLEKLQSLSIFDKKSVDELDGDLGRGRKQQETDEKRILNQINTKVEQIQAREKDLVDEKLVSQQAKRISQEKRRRRGTHFTNANRKRGRPSLSRMNSQTRLRQQTQIPTQPRTNSISKQTRVI